jgi:hypothetical protein
LADGIFGVYTEHAVREFQQNAGISGDGIVGDSTFSAIGRLRHAWEGKNVLRTETLSTGFARAAEVLESRAVRLYGSDELAGNVAERISNLAMATTPASLVDCVRTLSDSPDDQTLTIRLTSESPQPREIDQASGVGISDHGEEDQIPQVVYDSDMTINARVATAVGLATELHPQIIIRICYPSVEEVVQGSLTMREEQHIAITLLDALCLAFSKE